MKTYVVLYRVHSLASPMEDPFGFVCQAEDEDHAEEQTLNMESRADIVWVYEGGEYNHDLPNEEKFEIERKLVDAAYYDYFNVYDDYFNVGQAMPLYVAEVAAEKLNEIGTKPEGFQ